jgi:hypothetical protein
MGGLFGNGVEGTGGASGDGVVGVGGSNGNGVVGRGGRNGAGVIGTGGESGGVGVVAESDDGDALHVNGPAIFSRSGMVVVPSDEKTAVVAVPGLTAASLVLAVMQNKTGKVAVQAAVPDVAASQFTVFLSKAPAAPDTATVAWFVVN